ncbi:MAG: TetR/AcrR family transcriptional regulator [Streptosporangiales bacterium]
MPARRSGSGDPARTLELLWRLPGTASRRGPRQGLSVDSVVDAATALADSKGLEATTIRRVAQSLDVAPMTLYTYVPGKAEMLDLMLDAAYARMPRCDMAGQPWRERVTAIAQENRDLFEAHPWTATVSASRPPLGPGLMAKSEHELSALDGIGLTEVAMNDSLIHLLGFVQGWARAAADARAVQEDSAMSDQQWWAANAAVLTRVFDRTAYPTAVRVGSAAGAARGTGYSPEHAYEFGLRCVLDGIAARIADT